jgi:hypothetical protein
MSTLNLTYLSELEFTFDESIKSSLLSAICQGDWDSFFEISSPLSAEELRPFLLCADSASGNSLWHFLAQDVGHIQAQLILQRHGVELPLNKEGASPLAYLSHARWAQVWLRALGHQRWLRDLRQQGTFHIWLQQQKWGLACLALESGYRLTAGEKTMYASIWLEAPLPLKRTWTSFGGQVAIFHKDC